MERSSAKQSRVLGSFFLGLSLVGGVLPATAAVRGIGSDTDTAASKSTVSGSGSETTASVTGSQSNAAAAAPTWATLYRKYMGAETVGDCASCHIEAATAEQAYDWLAQQQYMTGNTPYLVDARSSCFSWLGGDMPPEGPSSFVRAKRDFEAWAAAGASKE